MNKKNVRKRIIFFISAAIIIFGISAVMLVLFKNYNETAKSNVANVPISTEKIEKGYIYKFYDQIIPLTNLTLETKYNEPSSLQIVKQKSVIFTEKNIETVIKNLENNGWKNVVGRISKFKSDTKSLLNLYQPETYDYSADGEKDKVPNFAAIKEHSEFAQNFLSDSGIIELLHGYNIELSDTPSDETFAAIFYAYYNGYRTDTYLRLHFSPDGTLEDAQLYAVRLDETNISKNVLPLKEAVKNAFYSSVCTDLGNDEYSIINVDVIYKNGIPFYELKLNGKNGMVMKGFALAIDYNEIKSSKELNTAFEDLMQNGTWQ